MEVDVGHKMLLIAHENNDLLCIISLLLCPCVFSEVSETSGRMPKALNEVFPPTCQSK